MRTADRRWRPGGELADQVYDALKAQIHDFRLVAGDRFSEAELGLRLGMSRTPVREALFRLRDEGFLGVESKLGWYVMPIDFDRLEQLYDLRVVLELASVGAPVRPCGIERESWRRSRRCGWCRRPSVAPMRARSAPATRSSTRRSWAPPATPRRRASTGT